MDKNRRYPCGHRRYESGQRWTLWRWTDVRVGGALYLRRLHLVQTPLFSIMLHWIVMADPEPDLHDHPVDFLSVMLRGGYDEYVPSKGAVSGIVCRTWPRWSWHSMRATDRHRIVKVQPNTLTLVFAGPVVRAWGFWTPEGFMPWRHYARRNAKRDNT